MSTYGLVRQIGPWKSSKRDYSAKQSFKRPNRSVIRQNALKAPGLPGNYDPFKGWHVVSKKVSVRPQSRQKVSAYGSGQNQKTPFDPVFDYGSGVGGVHQDNVKHEPINMDDESDYEMGRSSSGPYEGELPFLPGGWPSDGSEGVDEDSSYEESPELDYIESPELDESPDLAEGSSRIYPNVSPPITPTGPSPTMSIYPKLESFDDEYPTYGVVQEPFDELEPGYESPDFYEYNDRQIEGIERIKSRSLSKYKPLTVAEKFAERKRIEARRKQSERRAELFDRRRDRPPMLTIEEERVEAQVVKAAAPKSDLKRGERYRYPGEQPIGIHKPPTVVIRKQPPGRDPTETVAPGKRSKAKGRRIPPPPIVTRDLTLPRARTREARGIDEDRRRPINQYDRDAPWERNDPGAVNPLRPRKPVNYKG